MGQRDTEPRAPRLEDVEDNMEPPDPFYKVRARKQNNSAAPRAKRELAIIALAARMRDFPTLPANPSDENEVW